MLAVAHSVFLNELGGGVLKYIRTIYLKKAKKNKVKKLTAPN